MTSPAPVAPPRPPLARPREGRLLAGVAAGTAAHVGLDPLVVRSAFVVLGATGFGVVAYGLLWLTMPVAPPAEDGPVVPGRPSVPGRPAAPGVVGVLRGGPGTPSRRQVIGLALLGFGAVSLLGKLSTLGGSDVVLPLVLVVIGLAVIWRQLDADRTLARPQVRWVLAGGGVLAAAGVVLLLATTGQLANARNGFAATLVILLGVALATAPLWRRLLDSRAAERAARVRCEERADVAAHLHDSVLQTLALIQRNADDPRAVSAARPRARSASCARWLYDDAGRRTGTLAARCGVVAAEVEDAHGVPVEVVVVGDAPVDRAARRARGGRAGGDDQRGQARRGRHDRRVRRGRRRRGVAVFVRDRGAGLRPGPGRRTTGTGCATRSSARMERHGGTAPVRSAPARAPRCASDAATTAA